MLKASNLFALLVVFVLGGVAIKAQTPAPKIEKDVQVIVNGGDGGYLGVQTQEITKENFSKFGLRAVSLIKRVSLRKLVISSPLNFTITSPSCNPACLAGESSITFSTATPRTSRSPNLLKFSFVIS